MTSTARYLDYRTGIGPNGNTPVTVQQMDSSGQFQTVASNGLIPYFAYDLPTTNAGDQRLRQSEFRRPRREHDGSRPASIAGPYVNPTGIDANDLQLYSYSDDAATFTWGDSTLGRFNVTMSESSPFAQFTYTRGSDTNPLALLLRNNDIPGLNPDHQHRDLRSDRQRDPDHRLQPSPTRPAHGDAGGPGPERPGQGVLRDLPPLGLHDRREHVRVEHRRRDATLPNNPPQVPLFGVGANDILLSVPSQYGTAANPFHFVIASLPNTPRRTVAAFRNYAFNYITGSTNTLSFNPRPTRSGSTINVTTQNVDAQSTAAGALLEIYPLQYDNLDPNTYNLALSAPTHRPAVRGIVSHVVNRLRQHAAAARAGGPAPSGTVTIVHELLDGLRRQPVDPAGGGLRLHRPGDSPTATPEDMTQEIQLIDRPAGRTTTPTQVLTDNGQGNTYVWGQELQKLSTLIPVADQLGLTSERTCC